MPLRAIAPDELPPPDSRPALAFTFTRRRRDGRGCEVGLKNLADHSWSNLTLDKLPKDKAAARAWARAYAEQHGFPYAETAMRDPDPTAAELRTSKANGAARSVGWADSTAEAHEKAERYREAAESWIDAARHCEEYAAYVPGSEAKIGRAAASRVTMALRCLGRYRARLFAMQDGSALREVVAPREEK